MQRRRGKVLHDIMQDWRFSWEFRWVGSWIWGWAAGFEEGWLDSEIVSDSLDVYVTDIFCRLNVIVGI